MKFCEECGAQLEDDMRFCDECGTPVTDYEEVQPVAQPSEEARPTLQNAGKKPVKKGGIIAAVAGVLLAVVVVGGIVLLGKGGDKNNPENANQETVKQDGEEQETVKQDKETQEESEQKEQQETTVTKAIVADKKEESDEKEDAYPFLEEFIDVVCSYSDPPMLEGDAWKEYFKGEYECWESGEGYTNIVVGEDGHLKIKKDYLFDGMPYGAYLFGGQTDTMEYAFVVAKENTKYWSEFYCVVGSDEFRVELDTPQEGIVIGETITLSGVVNEYTGEWIEIRFAPYSDGECWFYLDDYYSGEWTCLENIYIPADRITQSNFDSYQEYYTFLWN